MSIELVCKLLKARAAIQRGSLVVVTMLVVLLPTVACGSGYMGLSILGVVPPVSLVQSQLVEEMGGKSISYWFISLAGIAITSWTFFAKWMLKQLEDQRKVNADLMTKLLGYMENDHMASKAALLDNTKVLQELRDHLRESNT